MRLKSKSAVRLRELRTLLYEAAHHDIDNHDHVKGRLRRASPQPRLGGAVRRPRD